MHKLLSLCAALALIAAGGVAARADDEPDENIVERGAEATGDAIKKGAEATGGAIKKGAEATGHAIKEGAQATGAAIGITDSDRARWEANERGEHEVKGTVTAIDRDTGKVDFKTADNALQLHFPPDALKGVEVGAPLIVELAYALPDNPPDEVGEADDREIAGDEPERGEHWMKGTVTDVNAKTGVVGVKTDTMPLVVQFAPGSVTTLKPGDKIAVELAFESTGVSGQHADH
jgi:hypothetical protein